MNLRWIVISSIAMLITVIAVTCSVHGPDEKRDCCDNSTETLARRKRNLIFHPISRGFFRVNIKDGVADNTSIWAQGIGFRMNIEFFNPPGLKITRRDVHQSVENMIMAHGFDGRACILRTFCEISKVMTPKSGILFKLFKMIFRSKALGSDDSSIGSSNSLPQGDEEYFPYLTANDCEELERHCPISQLDMDRLEDTAPDEADEATRANRD
ncbi:uncharacterized protein LOC131284674 [Anopheles ziemanni]|uniref:uncharacterized protein LOC131260294 n=1 Tax=Anopheles coustani TaxID=139045 RepID=UPI002659C32E|nr:uncharacterized protein LOC131260294 [Anopheles coustani]XP_058169521.1 uncharacterized protein LOC131284674 [Anopheles ziemanni]